MTTVIYDHQAFVMQRWGGISRYFAELAKHLAERPDMQPLVVSPYANNEYLEHILGLRTRSISAHYRHRGVGKLMALEGLLDQRAVRRAFTQHPGAVYHPTYYDLFLLEESLHNPVVITIHDMIYELFPEKLVNPLVIRQKKEMIQRADHIVAVSESTRADLLRFYPEAARKSSVIHHGVASAPTSPDNQALIVGDYLLFVGNRGSYKNFFSFAQTFAELANDYPSLKLICTGGGRFSRAETSFLKENGISDRVLQCGVPDNQLRNLYTFAKAFVFPSLYEGFGLPILEAMSCGAPCLLNDLAVFHEAAADAALYSDAHSVTALTRTTRDLLEDVDLQNHLRAAGYERVKEFSWSQCAREHAELYATLS